eukprot:1156350-Pelagomonas_calceolata.AAC.21
MLQSPTKKRKAAPLLMTGQHHLGRGIQESPIAHDRCSALLTHSPVLPDQQRRRCQRCITVLVHKQWIGAGAGATSETLPARKAKQQSYALTENGRAKQGLLEA